MNGWAAVRGTIRNSLRTSWSYRLDMMLAVAGLWIQVWLLGVVWRSVYGDSASVNGIDPGQAVSYAVLAACLQAAMMPWRFSALEARVRNGQVGVDMTRPLGLVPQVLAQNVGTFLAQLPITVAGLAWAVLTGRLTLPPSAGAVLPWLLAMLLGVVITLLMNLLMSLTCFWSLEIGGYMMLYRLGSGLLSGALIPLWFMPGWFATVLDWLPFRAQMFTPLSIYFGQLDGASAWLAIAGQVAWIAMLAGLTHLVWLRAERRVVVLGG